MVKRTACFLVFAILINLCGCGIAGGGIDSGDTQETAYPSGASTDAAVEENEAMSIENVWGDVIVTQIKTDYYPRDITDSGDLICTYSDDGYEPDETLLIYNIYSGDIKEIAQFDFPLQAYSCKINDDWVVYHVVSIYDVEGGSGEVYVYNRNTGEKTMYYSPDETSSAYEVHSSLNGNKLAIDIFSGYVNDVAMVNSYEYDLVTGEKSFLASQFASPKYAENTVIGLCEDESQDDRSKNYSVICELEDNKTVQLMDEGLLVYGFDVDRAGSVLITGRTIDSDSLYSSDGLIYRSDLYLLENGKATMLKKGQEGGNCNYGDPKLTERLAAYRYDNNAYVYDRALGKYVQLTSDGTSALFVTDKFIVWTTRSQENIDAEIHTTDVICYIEVDDLPNG
jgi:hypothetical protein